MIHDEEEILKTNELDSIIQEYRQKLDIVNNLIKETDIIRDKIQIFIKNNPNIKNSFYHEIIKNFIKRIHNKLKPLHNNFNNDDCFTWMYRFIFLGNEYKFEWYAFKYKYGYYHTDYNHKPEAAKALGISLDIIKCQHSKNY